MSLLHISGDIENQFIMIKKNIFLFKRCFISAALIAPSITYLIISIIISEDEKIDLLKISGLFFILLYFILATFAYSSQFTIFLYLLKSPKYYNLAELFYFGNFNSIVYYINQLGYFSFALGTIFLFSRDILKKGIKKIIALFFLLSAFLSVIAFIGLLLNSPKINSVTLPSGFLTLPLGVLTIIYAFKKVKGSI